MSPKPWTNEPIAIVGTACHFAGDTNSPSKLWELLRDPRDVRSEIPSSRFSAEGFYHPNNAHHGHSNVKHSYFIDDDLSAFDAEFFGINPVEGKAMDPQQRLLIETVYEATEAAGMTINELRGSDTGVYVGVMCGDYEAMLQRDLDASPTYFAVGTARSILSNRISYFFNWHGPSITMDTACSSSLVAVHTAVQALRSGESRMAVACGSNLILGPESYIIESKLKMLSPDGRSRMWDRDANGYARGDGVAAVMLKTLSAALADGDHIECLIKETGVNQDGATGGITMPSAAAQQDLIRKTYVKAGLDCRVLEDRPQYFEAHGTGTPAGDPVEAEAISRSFFCDEKDATLESGDNNPLYVGSIKTVLGHTEGTAGVAAILKASLAIQHSCIPPNLLFENLSPSVAPFYDNLEICRTAKPWPKISDTQPRRASVNSFGFGGTNAHAILESYDPPTGPLLAAPEALNPLFTPFVFSATSEKHLRANLSAYAAYLKDFPVLDVQDLAYTLRQRRSIFPYRATFTATSVDGLRSKILERLENEDTKVGVKGLESNSGVTPRVLGVFSGQGTQYARMGGELIEKSPLARQIIQNLESELARLPGADRPRWSLQAEILADASSSRVSEAAISQPLCTAVQIMLVDLLKLANIKFDAVIGHSSGEIAAAYAAGYLTARDAIYIAYYRGLRCQYAASPNGNIKGAMIAVGTSLEDATELCELDEFAGRINVAASNSPSSVTISGDEDAIEELQIILDDEKKFNRRLRVDQAYHSRHMLPCFEPYVESMQRAGVNALEGISSSSPQCTWFSSVYDGQIVDLDLGLSDVYWAENMTKPVLFSQALTAALSAGSAFDVALEVGSHPALKGPADQTIQDVLQKQLPYHGTLSRGSDAIGAASQCLGFLWSHLGKVSIDLNGYELAVSGTQQQCLKVVKNLPAYQWNHESKYWHESRRSRQMRLRKSPFHPLLGDISPDSAPHHLRWKNILKSSEIDWIEGHQVQSQSVFPAAGYVSTAVEAAQVLARDEDVRLIELSDFVIHQAVMFEADDPGIEVQIELSQISRVQPNRIQATFTYSAALGAQATDFSLAAGGQLSIILGETSLSLLPERGPSPPHLIDVEPSRLYNFMESLGYNFTGRFRSLSQLSRKLGKASCQAASVPTDQRESLLVHPAELDASFQSVMLAYSYPGDDQLRTMHLPTRVDKIRINPALCGSRWAQTEYLTVDSVCNPIDREAAGSGFSGHVNLYSNDSRNAAIQADGVAFVPLGTSSNDDRNVFYKMHWVPSAPDGITAAKDIPVTHHDTELLWVLSRIASYYLRKFDEEVPLDAVARSEPPLCHYLNYAQHMTSLLKSGKHKYAKNEWVNDTLDDVMAEVKEKEVSDNSDVRIMLLVGETMPRVFRGETTMIEHFRESGLLDEYYANGFGTAQSSLWLSQAVKQITDRHPHLSILEIGAGTGGATKNILSAIGRSFDRYTFTDISSSFFENAAEIFSTSKDRMVFKVYDAERDPIDQGFTEGGYDVIVASLVLHATAELDKTMRNTRRLLKPGGFLIVGEGSSDGPLQSGDGFIFGALPGWWLGYDEGRTLSPFVNVDQWDSILKRTGYSGVDTLSPPKFLDTFGVILFVSQAVDSRITLSREPLAPNNSTLGKVVIVGGQTKPVAHLVHELEAIFKALGNQVIVYTALENVDYSVIDANSNVIVLTELDHPVFKDITEDRWYAFRSMFSVGKKILWLTSGRLEDDPFSNMIVGFGRSAVHELTDLRLQFLDIPDAAKIDPRSIAETLVRSQAMDPNDDGILWTFEPEIVMDAEGRQLVPRLRPIQAANDRYNSARRSITHRVDIGESIVEMQPGQKDCTFRQLSRYDTQEQDSRSTMVELRITHVVLSAIKTPLGHKFLSLGVDSEGVRYIVLVSSLSSRLQVHEKSAIPCDLLGLSEVDFIALIAAHLVSMVIIDPIVPSQKLVVHNASDLIAQVITAQAWSRDAEVILTTDSTGTLSSSTSYVKLPPYLSRSEVRQIIPENISCFVGLSNNDRSENQLTILSTLSQHCRRETVQTIYSSDAVDSGPSSAEMLGQIINRAVGYAQEFKGQQGYHAAETIDLENLAAGERPDDPMTIVDWTASTSIPVQVTRFDIKPLFKGDKTYWLCGMSGALGISLCDWMIDRGVKYLVLTSRNPNIDPAWIENHKRNGVTVKILLCDVTDEAALRAVHQTIVQTLPPIVGALNGAMVLRDVSIQNMMFDQVTDVIRPKVLGSVHLDRIFHDVDLDFFVLLSSINCIIGNVGQANYAAANTGMCGVAANRRKRGLAATAVNVGAVIGAGYITRETDRALDVTVQKMAMMHLSEEDFHQIFAESMEAGYLESHDGPEISTGLLDISPDSPNIPQWYSNPKFANFIVHQTSSNDKKEQTAAASIQGQLQACQSQQDVLQVIKQNFAAQLRKILQSSTADDDLLSTRSTELGLDSLISVDIRSWFLKNFQVNIPVLKIIGNDVMVGLAEYAAENIPVELVPQVFDNSEEHAKQSSTPENSTDTTPSFSRLDTPDAQSALTTPDRQGSCDGESTEGKIDWDAESRPPEGITQLSSIVPPGARPSVILLTGVSGLLGHHLLNYLLENTTFRKVICVAVRKLTERLETKELPPPSDRVVYYEGDLRLPRLGLSEQDAASIFVEVDAVIHNGSDTSHLKFYQTIREANVRSTHELVRLCLPRMIPFHYVSSAGVALFAGKDAFPEISAMETGTLPPADGAHGYMCGKWACESLLERVNKMYGLKVWMHRPSTIIREGDDAITAKAEFDWVNALIHYAHRIKAVPKVEHTRGSFDLVRVQSVCNDIVRHLLDNSPMLAHGVSYVHEVGDIVIPLQRLTDIGNGGPDTYKELPTEEWANKAIEAGLHPAVAALIETFDAPGSAPYPALLKA